MSVEKKGAVPFAPVVVVLRVVGAAIKKGEHRVREKIQSLIVRGRHFFSMATHESIARRTALFSFAIRVLSAAIAYVSQIFIARWLGQFEYGVYVSVWTLVLILGNSGNLGFSLGAARFVPEYREQAPDLLRGFVLTSRAFALGFPVLMGGLGLLGLYFFSAWLQSYYIWPLYLALVCLPFFALAEVQEGIARCYNAPMLALAPTFILRPLLILLFMVLAHFYGGVADATTAMACAIAATALASFVQALALQWHLAASYAGLRRRFDVRRWLPYVVPLFLVDAFNTLLENIDVLLLSVLQSPEVVGVYFAVSKTLVLGAFVTFAVRAAVAHRFSEYHVSGNRVRLQAFVIRTASWTFWPTVGAVLVMLALGWPFLALFGADFLQGYPLLFILSIGLLVRSSIGPAERVVAMLDEPRLLVLVHFSTFLMALACHFLLISLYGMWGAAMASSLVLIYETIVLTVIIKIKLGLRVGIWS